MSEKSVKIGSRVIRLSRVEKVMFPEDGITKEDIVQDYRRIADIMVPYMKGRPLNMQQFPDGIGADGFYKKKSPTIFPIGFTGSWSISRKGRAARIRWFATIRPSWSILPIRHA